LVVFDKNIFHKHNIQGGQYFQHINNIIKDMIIHILLARLGKVYLSFPTMNTKILEATTIWHQTKQIRTPKKFGNSM